MKIRNGFVSNSSSSSFLIYGISEYTMPEKEQEDENDEDYDSCDDDDAIYELAGKAGLEYHSIEGCDGYYIGKSLASCRDDQTMGDFKAEVKALINKTFGLQPDKSFDIHEEAYYDG